MHLARLHTHNPPPSLPFRQSSRISSQISVKCPSLSLFLSLLIQDWDSVSATWVSFGSGWKEIRGRLLLENLPSTPVDTPWIRRLRFSVPLLSLSLDLHPKCLCSTISWLAISRYPLCSCPLSIPSIFRGLIGPGAIFTYVLSLPLSLSVSLSLPAIQWKRWLSHCSTSRIKRISDDSRFHLGLNAPMDGWRIIIWGRNGETRFSMAEFALISSDVKEDVLILLMILVYVYLRSCLIIKRKKERGKRRIIFISPSTFLKFLKFSESSVSCIKNTYVRKPHSVPLFIYPLFTKLVDRFFLE